MIHNLLRNRFYLGLFTWGGAEYPGKHEALVSIETFSTVQAIMASRRQGGDKQRKHPHYLKGTIFCARCDSRILFTRNRGRNAEYDYFACVGRHTHWNGCDLPYVAWNQSKKQSRTTTTRSFFDTIILGPDTICSIHDKLLKFAQKRNASVERQARRERKRILDLEAERRKLLQAHLGGAVPLDLLKEQQDRTTKELANAGAVLANTEAHWESLETNLTMALGLASHFGQAHRRADDTERRWINQAVVESIHVDVGGEIRKVILAEPFRTLLDKC